MEGYKQFKAIYNQKNAQCARNDPHGSYLTVLEVYTTAKSSGMLTRDMAALSFQDFVEQAVVYSTSTTGLSTLTFGEWLLLMVVEWKRGVK